MTHKPPKKKRRLRKLVMLASIAGALFTYRERKLAENEGRAAS